MHKRFLKLKRVVVAAAVVENIKEASKNKLERHIKSKEMKIEMELDVLPTLLLIFKIPPMRSFRFTLCLKMLHKLQCEDSNKQWSF